MFLTRLGFAPQAVVTGDITQIDCPGVIRLEQARQSRGLKELPLFI